MDKYRKFIVAFVGLVVTLAIHFFGEGSDEVFVVQAVVAALTVAGVYAVPNAPHA
ncbi:MAG TPA: hypothetical protein VIY86_07050 [Pirellulaceae bacterium]